ncbi:hotdog family protein [Pseudomonas sp. PS1]|uniref:Hotdog family protein n=1 Tax=Stutzerimonas marianensis TaxID=2929513 RepID=A0A9X1W6T0_9GAMM|nr:hotdog family protein [Pseudomonas marianensis]MCJ0974654.1 hotdog family protein [Pseudomonas marianensis]
MIDWPIASLVPHAGDMILLDAIARFDAESLEARLRVKPGGLFNLEDGSLPAWVGVEIMAQAVAAFAGCQARLVGLPVELGFLLGTRNYQCDVDRFPAGCDLQVRVERSLQDDNGMGVFECHLDGLGLHAEARLNVYRPPEVASYLQESAP